jgi:hypothetical protein
LQQTSLRTRSPFRRCNQNVVIVAAFSTFNKSRSQIWISTSGKRYQIAGMSISIPSGRNNPITARKFGFSRELKVRPSNDRVVRLCVSGCKHHQ